MKLIRDKYKYIIEDKRLRYANDEEKLSLIKDKILEEINELLDTDLDDLNEWCDVFEILYAAMAYKEIKQNEIENHRINKKFERGGFKEFIVLI